MIERALTHFKILGILFIAFLVGAVYLTFALFTQKFTAFDKVSLESSTIGLQLPDRADIKIRGVIVGEVLDTKADGDHATLTLGIYPKMMGDIPANVGAAIVPKTLFGEKYVSLLIPSQPQGTLKTGATIAQTHVSTEVEAVLDDLYPLLKAVRPGDLNMTLNAVSTALEGRGNELGETLATTDAYLKRLNPQIPQLLVDLRKTAKVSDIYSGVLPQIGDILDNTVTTTTTLRDRQTRLRALFDDVTGLSGTLRSFLSDNESNLVQLSNVSVAQLPTLARYSPEFPCLLKGIVHAGVGQAQAFRGFELHIVLETLPNQPRAYDAGDKPVYGDTRGPTCGTLPNPPFSQSNVFEGVPNFKDGVNRPTGKGTDRVAPGFAAGSTDGFVGSPYETGLYRKLAAPSLGIPSGQVGDLAGLLVGPMARGAKVSLK